MLQFFELDKLVINSFMITTVLHCSGVFLIEVDFEFFYG